MIRSFLISRQLPRLPTLAHGLNRQFSSEVHAKLTSGEKKIIDTLKVKFPGATSVEVSDISGGCGSMYQISVEAKEFKGKRTVQQHRMINEALAEEIKNMHGLQITTKISES